VSAWIDKLSEYLAARRGLLPLVGLALVIANLLLRLIAPGTWLSATDLVLHLGILTAIIGFMLAWAL
jgi:hypothetical protein